VREFLPLLPDYLEKVSQDYLDSEYIHTEHQKYLFQRNKEDGGMINKNVEYMVKWEEEKCP
jgi:hypothetical protein